VALDAPAPAAVPRLKPKGFVVGARTVADQGPLDDFALAPADGVSSGGASELLISVNLPGRDARIGIALKPSRVAAAWVAWLVVTLLIMAFWLPLPRLRRRADGPDAGGFLPDEAGLGWCREPEDGGHGGATTS
jgi:hypothetical protein